MLVSKVDMMVLQHRAVIVQESQFGARLHMEVVGCPSMLHVVHNSGQHSSQQLLLSEPLIGKECKFVVENDMQFFLLALEGKRHTCTRAHTHSFFSTHTTQLLTSYVPILVRK